MTRVLSSQNYMKRSFSISSASAESLSMRQKAEVPYFAAISPYTSTKKQPPQLPLHRIRGAIYLFRHGIIEVSKHDYGSFIKPFLSRIAHHQKCNQDFATGPLAFLNTYKSWITDAHVGVVNEQGLQQCRDFGVTFQQRYASLLRANTDSDSDSAPGSLPITVWTDTAARCEYSATEFARSLGRRPTTTSPSHNQTQDPSSNFAKQDLPLPVNSSPGPKVIKIDRKLYPDPCTNLLWHTCYEDIDQTAGQNWMNTLMTKLTSTTCTRLSPYCNTGFVLEPRDIYSMQLLHCYDTVSGRESPWMLPGTELFTEHEWQVFEFLRDGKYWFSEGYGAATPTWLYALPWFVGVMDFLKEVGESNSACGSSDGRKEKPPLRIAFTHREEVLYACTLLGLGGPQGRVKSWPPWSEPVKIRDRSWRVSTMASYLGHVGVEVFEPERGSGVAPRKVRFIVNGEVAAVSFRHLVDYAAVASPNADGNGCFAFDELGRFVEALKRAWEAEPPKMTAGTGRCKWIGPDS